MTYYQYLIKAEYPFNLIEKKNFPFDFRNVWNVFLNVNSRSIGQVWRVLGSCFLIGLGALSEMAKVEN